MRVRGLTIIVAGDDPLRLRTALALAATQAALGGAARLFADGPAAGLLVSTGDGRDGLPAAAPTRAELIDTALDLGVRVVACQSGLALAAASAAALDPRIETGGLTTILATLADDRLTVV